MAEQKGKIVVGIDEAGRGAVIGPMVIAGVSFLEEDLHKLDNLGVKDSKQLAHKKSISLSKKIEELAKDILVIKVGACKIDSFRRDGVNLNRLEAIKFADIINFLSGQKIYIDSPEPNPEKLRLFLNTMVSTNPEMIIEHKADVNYKIVSAASIIAKVERENDIEELKKEYGDFGPGYPSNEITMNWLREWKAKNKSYPEIVRKSWETVRELEGKRVQTKILSFFGRKKEECGEPTD